MSEDPDSPSPDEELETLLRGLVPTPMDVGFADELWRDRERTEPDRRCEPLRMQWGRVVPLTILCTVGTFVFALYQYGERLAKVSRSPGAAAVASAESPAVSEQPRFLPVSSHGTVVNTSSGGVIRTEEGPRERLRIDYRDAYHWHDPESGTNLRYFVPRSEEVVVPLQTD